MTALLAAEDILSFYGSRRRGAQYLAIENGDFVYLDTGDIAEGYPESYKYVTTHQGTQAQILLGQDTIADGDWFPDALDEDGSLRPEVAGEMADIINADAGLAIQVAVEAAQELGNVAERDAQAAQASAMARARGVVEVVRLCGGNQSEAARRLGVDQSRVNQLVKKARAGADA